MSPVGTMAGALLYLRVTSLVGRIRSRLLRLKQPKYLLGALVGAAYVYLVFLRRGQGRAHRPGGAPIELSPDALVVFAELGALLLLVALIVNWTVPRNAALAFSEAEIAFLFPAPVNRRMLVHYRLLGTQLGIAFTALVLTLAFGRGQAFGGHPLFRAIGWWLTLATLDLHLTGTSFVYSKVLNRSLTRPGRKVATLAAVWIAIAGILLWCALSMRLPEQSDLRSAFALGHYVAVQLHAGPMPWLLALPRLLIAPYFAAGTREFLMALAPALAILIVHYLWVVRTEVSFEEASIARAEKRAARVRAIQQGDWRGQPGVRKAQPVPFELRGAGRPEVAFLWKNLLAAGSVFRPKVAAGVLLVIAAGASWIAHRPALEPLRVMLGMLFGILLVATVLFGPLMARQDLRSDLKNSDLLKTYPLEGWQIVLGELLTPVAILSGLIWMGLLAELLLWPAGSPEWLAPSLRGGVALAVAVLAPPFVALQLLVPNAAAVVFPAWAQSAGNRAEHGIEVMGQRIIFMAGQLLVTALATVPAAVTASVAFFLAQWVVGLAPAAALAVIVALVVLTVEAGLGVAWLGGRFEAFDLSAELRP